MATQDLLGIYLNNHLAGATTGTGLARRMAASAEPGTERATTLNRLASENIADRAALLRIMTTLGIAVRGYKVFAACAGERAGRLKLNGRLLTRSPLSDLEETEVLRLGVDGKAAGWRTLRELAERDGRLDADRLDDLLTRADRQSSELESLRVGTAKATAGKRDRLTTLAGLSAMFFPLRGPVAMLRAFSYGPTAGIRR